MFTIKQVPSQETFTVRQPVLRPGKPVSSCIFEGDDLNTTAHFGIFYRNSVAGVISVFRASSSAFSETEQFQIRGMAILGEYQKQGLGAKLLQKAEEYINEAGGKLIWFNAREAATGFYRKTGYRIIGSPFDIPGIGTHYIMYKYL